jgi:hypothetical protein
MDKLKYCLLKVRNSQSKKHIYWIFIFCVKYVEEKVEDTKGIIIIRKSKDRQHNGQKNL